MPWEKKNRKSRKCEGLEQVWTNLWFHLLRNDAQHSFSCCWTLSRGIRPAKGSEREECFNGKLSEKQIESKGSPGWFFLKEVVAGKGQKTTKLSNYTRHGEPGKLFQMEPATAILQGRLAEKGYGVTWVGGKKKKNQKNGSSVVSGENKHIYVKMELSELRTSVCLMWYLGNIWKMYICIQEDWDRNNTKI